MALLLLLTGSCHRAQPPPSPVVVEAAPSPCDVASALAPLPTESSSSSLALARLGDRRVALLADEDDSALRVIDLATGRAIASSVLSAPPAHVVVTRSGRLHVSLPGADSVLELTMSPNGASTVCAERATPPEPIALALADDDATLLVASRRGRALTMFRAGSATKSIALSRDPTGVLVAGTRALVAHRAGSIVSVVALDQRVVAREVSFAWRDRIGLASMGGHPIADMPRFAVQAHGLARVNDRVVAPMVLAYPGETHLEIKSGGGYGAPSVQGVDGYFPHEPARISLAADGSTPRVHVGKEVLEEGAQRLSLGRVEFKNACLLPRSVASDGGALIVGCLGIDQLQIVRDGDTKTVGVPSGPVAVAVDSGEAVVWSQFARVLSVVSAESGVARAIPIAAEKLVDPDWADGRKTFHEPVAFDGRACAGCHPDGLDDGLVWSSPLGPMQPPVLAARLEGTAPYGWLGKDASLHAHLQATITRLGAKPMAPTKLEHLLQYVRAIKPTTPRALTPLEKRGREVFTNADCGNCHSDDGRGSDGLQHDVGTGGSLDTPSLASVGGSAPYMHDGRFASLREAIARTAGKMGPQSLADADLDALVAYLRTL